MLTDFLFQTWDIFQVQTTLSWWEETKPEVSFASWVKCKLYNKSPNITLNTSENTDNIAYECILEPIIWIKEWFYIYIDSIKYKIVSQWLPKYRRGWVVDHISVKVQKWQ